MGTTPNKPDGLSDDEWRLVRLFRCLGTSSQSEILRKAADELLAKYPIDSPSRRSENPQQEVEEELREELDWRLSRVMPCVDIADLIDYDWHIEEEGWSEGVAEVILGSSDDDDNAAEELVNAYLEGAKRYDVPLPTDFRETDVSLEEAEKDIREDLHSQALALIRAWRERVVALLETSVREAKSKDGGSKNVTGSAFSKRPVYVRVEFDDEENRSERTYTLSPVPFWMREGEDVRPTKKEKTIVTSYADLQKALLDKFGIPQDLIPSRKYFDPTPAEAAEEVFQIHRTVPEEWGEPEWQMKAAQAVRDALEDALIAMEKDRIEIDGTICSSMDDLRRELEKIAESAGGKQKTPTEPYGQKYEDLVAGVLLEYSEDFTWLGACPTLT